MKRTIRVHIGEAARLVGTLRYDQQGARENAVFEYDATWLADPERFAIEPAWPWWPARSFIAKPATALFFML